MKDSLYKTLGTNLTFSSMSLSSLACIENDTICGKNKHQYIQLSINHFWLVLLLTKLLLALNLNLYIVY